MNLHLGKYSITLERSESPPKRAPTANLASGTLPWPPGGVPGGPATVYPTSHDNVHDSFRQIRETVAICMHARSEAIGRGKFHAVQIARVKGKGQGVKGEQFELFPPAPDNSPLSVLHSPLEPDHPLSELLANPNPIFDMSDLLELSSQWLDATGNAIWIKVRDANGVVVELWPASAMSFQIEHGTNGLPARYRFPQSNTSVAARDIIHIRRPDIRMSPFFGHGIISDILDTAKADTAVRLFQSRFFENDACPRAVLRWPQGSLMTQEEMDRLRNAWESKYATPANAGRIGILTDGGEVQLLGSGAKELDFSRSKEELRNAIREAFRVPRIFFGDTDNVNLSNAETSYAVFMRDVVDHALLKHAQAFTRALASEFASEAGTITIEHDSLVLESASDKAQQDARYLARVEAVKQSMTIDEQRATIGLPPLSDGRGNALILAGEIIQP